MIFLDVFPFQNFKSLSIDTTYHSQEDDEDIGIHTECYRSALWLYIRRKDELSVWDHKCNKKSTMKSKKSLEDQQTQEGPKKLNGENGSETATNRDSDEESTHSERQFRRQYQSVTHRMIHRRASIEMYKKAIDKTFGIRHSIVFSSVH